MRKLFLILTILSTLIQFPAYGQDWSRLLSGAKKAIQAYSVSDAELKNYVHQYIEKQDSASTVLPASNKYVVRLANLVSGLTSVDGTPLNFKVYQTNEINAFACADGSVRVYTGLMDLMTDDEILGVLGHEIGHVAHKDSKNAFKNAILTSAAKDALAATSSKVALLTDSQLGAIGESLANARYSRKQEEAADDYGYEFLKNAGKNPWAMAMAFEKLKSMETTVSGAKKLINNIFSDHPDTDKRIERMSKRAIADGFTRPSNVVTATKATSKAKTTTKKTTIKKTATTKKITSKK